jgi:hypothetical protein
MMLVMNGSNRVITLVCNMIPSMGISCHQADLILVHGQHNQKGILIHSLMVAIIQVSFVLRMYIHMCLKYLDVHSPHAPFLLDTTILIDTYHRMEYIVSLW